MARRPSSSLQSVTQRKQTMFAVVLLVLLGCVVALCVAEEYTSEDFSRLVRENPLVIAGEIQRGESEDVTNRPGIRVSEVLKNGFEKVAVEKNQYILLNNTSGNLFWASAVIEKEKGQRSVWLLRGTTAEGELETCDVVAHFLLDENSLKEMASGENVMPVEQWGSADETNMWAVVRVPEARSYTRKGKFLKTLKSGSVMSIQKITTSSAGEMALGSLDGQAGADTEVAVLTQDLKMYPGALAKVDSQRRSASVKAAGLEYKIETLRARELDKQNPVSNEYRKAKAAYEQFWAKADDLKARSEKASGGERSRILNELRALKGKDIQVANAYKEAKKKYDSWKSSHLELKNKSFELQALEREFAALERMLK